MLRKMNLKKWIPIAVLVVVLVLSVSSLNSPWWAIKTPVSNQIRTNITDSVYYNPSKTVSASHVEPNPNNTLSVVVAFTDLGSNQSDTSELNSVFSVVYYITVSGAVLVTITLIIAVVSALRTPILQIAWILPLIAAILLLVGSIYLVTVMPPTLSKLATVVPAQIAVAPGAGFGGFWGSSQTWMWGAGIGLTEMVLAAFMSAAATALMRLGPKKQDIFES